jgi:hypothetical protein
MARLQLHGDLLVVRLNPIEKLAALSRNPRIPVAEVRDAYVVDQPLTSFVPNRVTMGFAARTAPASRIATVGPRAATALGKAMLVIYLNRRSVVVETQPGPHKWALIVVSASDADKVAASIRQAALL